MATQELGFLDDIGGGRETAVLTGVKKVVADYAYLLQSLMIGYMNAAGARAEGTLQESLRIQLTFEGLAFGFELYMEDYWKFVEEGVQGVGADNQNTTSPFKFKTINPSKKHVRAIERWMQFKGIAVDQPNTGEGLASGEITRQQAAYNIARSIKRKGTKPVHFLSRSVSLSIDDFKNALFKEVGFAIKVDFKAGLE